MEVRSIYKNARISPKKARDVAREIQGLPVSDAIDTLNFTPKKAAFLIGKTLKSAVANAENNHDLAADSLHVKEANISAGPSFRRYKPRARGSASAIRKRTSHIYIILTDEVEGEENPVRERKPKGKKKTAPKEQKVEPEEEETIPEETGEASSAEEVPSAGQVSDEAEEKPGEEANDTPAEVSEESTEVEEVAEEAPEESAEVEETAEEEEKKED